MLLTFFFYVDIFLRAKYIIDALCKVGIFTPGWGALQEADSIVGSLDFPFH